MGSDSSVPGARHNVLLVDDDSVNLLLLKRMLRDMPGVKVHAAESGPQALELAESMEFAVALLDVAMPSMSGLETAELLRAMPANADTPIIFMSAAKVERSDLFAGYEKGAVDYLLKPLDKEVLLPKVAAFVDMDRARHEARASLQEAEQEAREFSSLLAAARAVLNLEDFQAGARSIFAAAKQALGATAGYVALLSPDGQENDILFLDPGGRACDVDLSLPMPIRGLRARAYAEKRVVMDNDFSTGPWVGFLPQGHVNLDNVLFAPLLIQDEPQGVLGLANKPGGFTGEDMALAAAFGDFAAIALRNSRNLEQLKFSQRNLLKAQTWARMGCFVRDLAAKRWEWTEGMFAVLGMDQGEHGDDPLQELPHQVREPLEQLLDQAAQTQKPVEAELELQVQEGDARTLMVQVEPELDAQGRVIRLLGTCLDLTRQKAMARQLLTSQRLEAVGQLAGGVAHEINTPIQYMITNLDFFDRACAESKAFYAQVADLAAQDFPRAKELRDILEESGIRTYMSEVPAALADVREGLSKVSFIVSAMRELVPAAIEPFAPMDLNAMVRHLVTVTTGRRKAGVRTRTELDQDLPRVVASQGEISQAVLNVLMNAIQAVSGIDGQGQVLVRTSHDHDHAVIEVRDNGPGIPEAIRERVFDPFFTTKEPGSATGQGLALTHFAVLRHGGSIDFTSQEGQGTAFFIRLPVAGPQGVKP